MQVSEENKIQYKYNNREENAKQVNSERKNKKGGNYNTIMITVSF
jgi:hypothetical protein